MASTTTTYRQAKEVWELYREVPDEWKDKMPATVYDTLTAGATPSKCARCSPMVVGHRDVDEANGFVWVVTMVQTYSQDFDSRKRGKAPKAWLRLIATEE